MATTIVAVDVTHGVARHSLDQVPFETLSKIDVLTRADRVLYSKARAKFMAQILAFEKKHHAKLLCGEDRIALFQLLR